MPSLLIQIFNVVPSAYMNPDAAISGEYRESIDEVNSWGLSQGHSRTVNQTTRAERDALQDFTGERVPATPAQAAGGKANKGGYYPFQPAMGGKGKGKGKSAGRSAPYPQTSSSSGSSWWSPSWSDWSWSGWSWSGRNWWQ